MPPAPVPSGRPGPPDSEADPEAEADPRAGAAAYELDQGGEAACLLHLICPGCDLPADGTGPGCCARCGTALPS
ncbi:hypothetical protein ACWDR0_24385 [Streptomyces sp. NPDC003691]